MQKESELGVKTIAKDCNSKTTFALHNHKHIMEPSASRNTVQHHGLDGVSTPHVIEINPKSIETEEDPENQTNTGSIAPRFSLPESEHADNIQKITTLYLAGGVHQEKYIKRFGLYKAKKDKKLRVV